MLVAFADYNETVVVQNITVQFLGGAIFRAARATALMGDRKLLWKSAGWFVASSGSKAIIIRDNRSLFNVTVDVMLTKREAREECWNCKPTTAAGALCPLPMKTAWVAVTSGLGLSARLNNAHYLGHDWAEIGIIIIDRNAYQRQRVRWKRNSPALSNVDPQHACTMRNPWPLHIFRQTI